MKVYNVALAGVPSYAEGRTPAKRQLFQVVDAANDDAVVDSFRNEVIANRVAASNPSYRVRGFSL